MARYQGLWYLDVYQDTYSVYMDLCRYTNIYGPWQDTFKLLIYCKGVRELELPHFSEDHLFIPQAGEFLQETFILLPCVSSFQLLFGISKVVKYSSFFIFHFAFIG